MNSEFYFNSKIGIVQAWCVEAKFVFKISNENPNSVCNVESTNLNDIKYDSPLKLSNFTWQSSFTL